MRCTNLIDIPDQHIIGSVDGQGQVSQNSFFTKGSRVIIHVKKPGGGMAHLCSETAIPEQCYAIQLLDMAQTPTCPELPQGRFDLYNSHCEMIHQQVNFHSIICTESNPVKTVIYFTT